MNMDDRLPLAVSSYVRVRYDAVPIYKRRIEIWKDADFDTVLRPGDAFLN